MTPDELERERPRLFGIAYRILGSAADAEDVLQDAFLRARAIDDARSPRALLTTIVTRLCLDEVRSARRRREEYVGPWLPEPILADDAGVPSSADRVGDAESVSMALLVVLEALSPLERAVWVLREVLDHDFAEIAEAVGRTPAACRQLYHRARQHVSARRRRFPAPTDAQRDVTARFLGALAAGDLDALAGMFTADVTVVTDHGGKARAATRTVTGPDRVGRLLAGLHRKLERGAPGAGDAARPVWINGAPGFVVLDHGAVTTAVVLEIAGGAGDDPVRIAAVHVVRNPDKLGRLDAALAAGPPALG
jgi:RNA polymerase sigma-70 factor, ECF subfamily